MRIDVFNHNAGSQQAEHMLGLVLQKLDFIMTDLTALKDAVARETEIDRSAIVLIQGLAEQLRQAGTDPVALNEIITSLSAESQALADAVAANTPVAVPPVPPGFNPSVPRFPHQIDPATGRPYAGFPGVLCDPATGLPYPGPTGAAIDPRTGRPYASRLPYGVDPRFSHLYTDQYTQIDPRTGRPYMTAAEWHDQTDPTLFPGQIDPRTGHPYSNQGMSPPNPYAPIDPSTGLPYARPSWVDRRYPMQPFAGQIDPATHAPYQLGADGKPMTRAQIDAANAVLPAGSGLRRP